MHAGKTPVIDIHCHVGTAEKLQAPWTTRADLSAYLERAREAGIHKTVVFAIACEDYERANAEVARTVAEHPDRLVGFARIHPERDRGRVKSLVRKAIDEYGFRGVKVHGGEALPTREVCEVAKQYNLPILVDIVGRVEVLPLLATEYPEVNFVIAHLGSFADDWSVYQLMPYLLARYPNLYADTSGVRFFDYLLAAVKIAGAHKVLFGSDGPLLHPGLELCKIRLLKLNPEEEELVLAENAKRLLQL
jgi:predicted TIM-barrel fold metal-dependent hydrolase